MRAGLRFIIGVIAAVLVSSGASAEDLKKYIVNIKPEHYQNAQQSFLRGGGFFGLRQNSVKYLDHLNMAVVEMSQAQASALKNNSSVDFIEEDRIIPQPHYKYFRKNKKFAPASTKVSELTWGLTAISADKAWPVTKGLGARVLVLDTGIDNQHPDITGRFEKAKSFMGVSTADDVGHGTHVSGTILADGSGSGLFGVAPEAKLLMAKVCGASGCSTAGIVQGVEWGIQEKVDVMNLSLGGPFISASATAAYQKAEQAGVVVVAASGNDGTATVSYPAAVSTVIAVGAINPDLTKASFSQWGPELDVVAPGADVLSTIPQGTGREGFAAIATTTGKLELKNTVFQNSDSGLKTISGEIVFVGLGKTTDFENKDLTGKIALIQRGEITFAEKVTNALAAKANGVLVYNNEPGLILGGLQNPVKIPVLMIEQNAGADLAAATDSTVVEMGIVTSDYASFQGTSMASPHVAGLAALVKGANKNLKPSQVRTIISSTATPLSPNGNNELGAGVVNAEKAVAAAKTAVQLPMAIGL
ncbi:MAG: S8 family serine peptidase [Bdellovibrionaceae bacterium]|nr:S8 family serine peptidase [Pseudobdellovibrionaceae bacterium]